MLFGNAAFLVGPVSALLMVPLAMAVIAVLRRPRWAIFATVALATGVGVTWLAYWVLWWKAFDYLDAGRPVPSPIDVASNIAMAFCAGSVLLLGATAVVTIVAGSVQLSKDGQVIRIHPIRHDRAKELGAFANPQGRPRRKNSAAGNVALRACRLVRQPHFGP
jgi:hypothetical protein